MVQETNSNWNIIASWVGIAISLILGVFNFIWGKGIVSRIYKIKIKNPEITISIIEKKDRQIERVFIKAKFTLIRTSGEHDIYVKRIRLQLNKKIIKKLSEYFDTSPCIIWTLNEPLIIDMVNTERKLTINESQKFEISGNFNKKNLVKDLYIENLHIDPKLDFMKKKCKIIIEDDTGREWKYKCNPI